MLSPVLLLTRPESAARRFLDALTAEGLAPERVVISPILQIRHIGTLPDMAGYGGLIFTSANGVTAYADAGGPTLRPCFTVGEATAEAARKAGLSAQSAKGDADALVTLILDACPEGPLLHVRGVHSRGAVAKRLSQGGIETHEAILYEQAPCPLSPEAEAALAGSAPVVAPVFSPRSAELLAAAGPFAAPLYLAAMSAAVAEPLASLDAEAIEICAQPSGSAMRAAVAQLWQKAQSLESRGARQ